MHVMYINIYFTVAFCRHMHPVPVPLRLPHLCYGFHTTHTQHALVQFSYNVFHFLVHCVMTAAPYRTATNTLLIYDDSYKFPVVTFSNYQLNAQFLYSSTICMLHYDPQHVLSSTLLILRRTNCITRASGIVTLCKQPYSMQIEPTLTLHPVRLFTESDDTRSCSNTICPPEDEQGAA